MSQPCLNISVELARRDISDDDDQLEIDLSPGFSSSLDSDDESLQGSQLLKMKSFIDYTSQNSGQSPPQRSVTPVEFIHTDKDILADHWPEATPVKQSNDDDIEPITPTTNLKMLADALSPELRHREMLKEKARALGSLDSDHEVQRKPTLKHTGIPKMPSFEDDDTLKTMGGPQRKIFRTSLSKVYHWVMHGSCMGHAWVMHGSCMGQSN